jgi:hypothetical protein
MPGNVDYVKNGWLVAILQEFFARFLKKSEPLLLRITSSHWENEIRYRDFTIIQSRNLNMNQNWSRIQIQVY